MVHKKKETTSHTGSFVAGIAGLTAAAVGAYYLYGSKDAAKNRAIVKGWMLKAKGEVLEQLEGAKEITQEGYMTAVDAVLKKYNKIKSVEPKELESFIESMKSHWDNMQGAKKKTSKKKHTGTKRV